MDSEQLGRVCATLEKIEKDFYGNGQKGIVERFLKVETEHETVMDSIDKLATAFSALARNDSNKEAVRKVLGRSMVIAASIIAAAGTIVGIFYTIHNG